MHGPGVDEFIRDICERLASSGFATIAPDLYHRQREPLIEPWTKIRDTEALQDMAQAVKALTALSGTDPECVGVVGFCMGGRLAFLHAANNPALRAAVVFHGGNILVARDGIPSPFDQARNIRAPVLGLFGADDPNPSRLMSSKLIPNSHAGEWHMISIVMRALVTPFSISRVPPSFAKLRPKTLG
jgi:carboxymethylenebutenolidase